jgi:hypothetical protein
MFDLFDMGNTTVPIEYETESDDGSAHPTLTRQLSDDARALLQQGLQGKDNKKKENTEREPSQVATGKKISVTILTVDGASIDAKFSLSDTVAVVKELVKKQLGFGTHQQHIFPETWDPDTADGSNVPSPDCTKDTTPSPPANTATLSSLGVEEGSMLMLVVEEGMPHTGVFAPLAGFNKQTAKAFAYGYGFYRGMHPGQYSSRFGTFCPDDEWVAQAYAWTCCGGVDADKTVCCKCGHRWHFVPNFVQKCREDGEPMPDAGLLPEKFTKVSSSPTLRSLESHEL